MYIIEVFIVLIIKSNKCNWLIRVLEVWVIVRIYSSFKLGDISYSINVWYDRFIFC